MISRILCLWKHPPLWLQVFLLLLGALFLVQTLTIIVFLRLPPPPPQLISVTAIAETLRSGRPPRGDVNLTVAISRDAQNSAGKLLSPDKITGCSLAVALGVTPDRVRFRRIRPMGAPPFIQGDDFRRRAPPGATPEPPRFNAANDSAFIGPGPPDRRQQPFDLQARNIPPWDADYVWGDFSAALKMPNGEWRTVRTQHALFSDGTQRHFLLWVAFASVVAAPTGLLLARSISAPVLNFANACEMIGKNPNAAPLPPPSGPAEIFAAAQAFRTMHMRLQRLFLHQTGILSAISHDFRAPLARLKFQADEWPEPYRETTTKNILQMERLLAILIDATRREAGYRRLESCDLSNLLGEVCEIFDGAATLMSAEPLLIEADAAALERLFYNLIDNAVKYGGRARVQLQRLSGEVLVTVEDDGQGLPIEAREIVFRPFERYDATAQLNPDGLGIGLMVARSIARAHGGDVTLTNGDRGLKAVITLPFRQI